MMRTLRVGHLPYLVAALVFLLAYEAGAYGLTARTLLGVSVWWALLVGIGLGLWPLEPPTRLALAAVAGLTALSVVTLASTFWAPSAENAFSDFNRATIYLGILLLTVCGARRASGRLIFDGIALGTGVLALVSLASRCFQSLFGASDIPKFLPSAVTRLSYPIGYWNGLAIMLAIATPLLLRVAMDSVRHPATRAVAMGALPAFAATMYLASSRGGIAVAAAALVMLVVLAARRWFALAAVGTAVFGSWVAIRVVQARPELVDGPLSSAAAHSQGHSAALLLALICPATGAAWSLGCVLLGPASWNLAPRSPRAAAALIGLAVVLVVASSHPLRHWDDFKRAPTAPTGSSGIVQAHLASGNGSGRWQFWTAAVDQWRTHPVRGSGAGTFQEWWSAHGSLPMIVKNAHSLYLETLGELGILGFAAVAIFIVAGLAAIVQRARGAGPRRRNDIAAVGASFVAFAFALGIDWMWQMTVVTAIGIVLLGTLVGPATADSPLHVVDRVQTRRAVPFAATLLFGWLGICALMIPYLVAIRIQDSQANVREDDYPAAIHAALDARAIQPWAATPWLQLALVEERIGDIRPAVDAIDHALARDGDDWSLWLIKARLEVKLGHMPAARAAIDRSRSLNPHSPLFDRTA